MMNFIAEVGNLKLYYEQERDLFGRYLVVYVLNGCDIVERETFPDAAPGSACRCADITLQRLDIVTLDVITAALPEIRREYDGHLLSGKIAGFDRVEYFKQFPDNPRYYKHYISRPAM